ncbi:heme lyase CcmF/NrfE family subunit [Ktedonosporobacter rubrisoli]|uniref:Heme lyase CcmF/NrfE family subunit n=1 Tax=Ktedonosporobacter rubrisoli TaxID=2509675 RepID=A0A4P6K0Q9_KTERU|nr:heme lyase CcmF/NrfE family subunit [Ktedonosporobacter rubrisoli]QBD81220.1 heme lyase CcmF/NrfE family subunit [Ktedonosporobacter rubrisoli]
MYFSDIGIIALILATGFALYTVVIAVLGAVRNKAQLVASAKLSTLTVAFFLLLAAAALVVSFLTHDFGVRYVAQHSSREMPWYFTVASFYGGQEGSLLYWAVMLAIFSALFVFTSRRAPKTLVPYTLATLMGIELFFLIVLATASNPFVRVPVAPDDGNGLNPLLMDPGMLIHPPLLLMGFMSFSVPYALAIAAMVTGVLNNEWLRSIRRWALASWTIQTAGLLLGAWWAYHVLGWGGYWSWDPVENAALLPWLTTTAFLHSAMVQERRGMLKVWNLFLVIASFALAIFGTYEVRSGVISSVHSFAYSDIGSYFFTFLVIVVAFSSGLFLYRLPRLQAEQEFDSVVSREGVFLFNNLLLIGITFATLWGTIFPLVTALLRGQTMSVGAPFYNQVVGPLIGVLVLAMGVGPLLGWRRTSLAALWRNLCVPAIVTAVCAAILPIAGVTNVVANIGFSICAFTATAILYELWRGARVRHAHGEPYVLAVYMLFQRYRQRYGGYLVHLGMVMLVVGIIGSAFFQVKHDAVLKAGQDTSIGGYQITFMGNIDMQESDRETVTAQLRLWSNGQSQGYIYPGRIIYRNYGNQPASIIPILSSGLTDLYIVFADYQGATEATLQLFINPLVPLVWYGGLLMLLGGLICWWPERRRVARVAREAAPKAAQPEAKGVVA